MDRFEVVVAGYPDRERARSDFDELIRYIESGAVRSERRHVDRVRPRCSSSIPIINGEALAGCFSSRSLITTRTSEGWASSPMTK